MTTVATFQLSDEHEERRGPNGQLRILVTQVHVYGNVNKPRTMAES
jgi:hypothetical protein